MAKVTDGRRLTDHRTANADHSNHVYWEVPVFKEYQVGQ